MMFRSGAETVGRRLGRHGFESVFLHSPVQDESFRGRFLMHFWSGAVFGDAVSSG